MKGQRIPYSAAEMAWLEAHRVMVIGDYAAAFNATFGRSVSPQQLHGLRKRKRWLIGRELCNAKAKGRSTLFTLDQIAWLEANRQLPIADYTSQFNAAFECSFAPDKLHAFRKRRGLKTGRTGQFPKGQTPANKGKKMPYNANSARTQFKKGELPRNTKFAGHERVTTDGYVMISVEETNPHTGFDRRYVLKHKHLWEKKNGALPEDMCLKCLDGNRANTDPSNWEAIPRAMIPLLTGRWNGLNYDDAAPELKASILAVAKLKYASKKARANV